MVCVLVSVVLYLSFLLAFECFALFFALVICSQCVKPFRVIAVLQTLNVAIIG